MSGIGVITNPLARKNLRNPGIARHLGYILGERGELAQPSDLDALMATARSFRERDIDVLCVNGGDGSIHKALTAMVAAYDGHPLPRLAVLPGGTMNIVANSVGVRVGAPQMLNQVVESYHGGPPLRRTRRWLMRVEGTGCPLQYGFLFGNGIIAGFLEAYYELDDPTPAGAGMLLARGAVSAMVRGAFARRLTRPFEGRVVLDGDAWVEQRWTAVAVGTVEQIGLGFTPFYLVPDHPERMHVVGIAGSVAALALDLQRVYRGVPLQQAGNRGAACRELVLTSPDPIGFMVDGDFYKAQGEVRLSMGPAVDFLLP